MIDAMTQNHPLAMPKGKLPTGEVLKPGDPEYDRLMSMVIRPHRGFVYIDEG